MTRTYAFFGRNNYKPFGQFWLFFSCSLLWSHSEVEAKNVFFLSRTLLLSLVSHTTTWHVTLTGCTGKTWNPKALEQYIVRCMERGKNKGWVDKKWCNPNHTTLNNLCDTLAASVPTVNQFADFQSREKRNWTCCRPMLRRFHSPPSIGKKQPGIVDFFTERCGMNHLQLNTGKTNELVVDFSRRKAPATPVSIQGIDMGTGQDYLCPEVHWTTSWTGFRSPRLCVQEGPELRSFSDSVGLLDYIIIRLISVIIEITII